VRVIESYLMESLEWDQLGTPVKVLLDKDCRPVKIGGRMGNVRISGCFFDTIRQQIGAHGDVAQHSN
ncbi:MAG: hypothetical protein AAB305_00490, partial [Candidatus Zixiibacteriota bacterium]